MLPKIKGLVNKLTAISPTSSAPTVNIDSAHQVARENNLPVLPRIQPATKPKSTVYTDENQTKSLHIKITTNLIYYQQIPYTKKERNQRTLLIFQT